MKKLIVLLVLIVFYSSCKDDAEKAERPQDKVEIGTKDSSEDKIDLTDGKYRIVFEGIFKEDDLLLVYYTTEAEEKLSSEKNIRKKIIGSPNTQNVVIVFEENEKPYNVRIDFSDNKNQKEVKLNTLMFLDQYNRIVINSNNIENYFVFNDKMSLNKEEGFLVGEIYKINEKDAYNPYFVANKLMIATFKSFNEASLKRKKTDLIDDIYNVDYNDGRQRLIIKGVFESDDLVLVFYAQDSLESFDIKKAVRKTVVGSNNMQELVFTLPDNIMASKIKLDISDKKQQKGIYIESLIIKMDDSEIVMDRTNLHDYFYANSYIDYNKTDGTFKCKVIKENNIEKYNPYFISSPKLIEDLKYL